MANKNIPNQSHEHLDWENMTAEELESWGKQKYGRCWQPFPGKSISCSNWSMREKTENIRSFLLYEISM